MLVVVLRVKINLEMVLISRVYSNDKLCSNKDC
jgi:hypothetical protein